MGDFVSKDASSDKEQAIQEPLLWDSQEQSEEAVGQNGVLAEIGHQGISDFSLYTIDSTSDGLATVLQQWQEQQGRTTA
jgi:hypothetical protein